MAHRINQQNVDLNRIANVIREAESPVSLAELTREAIRSYLTRDNAIPVFAAGRHYAPGSRVQFNGRLGDVVKVQRGKNAVQGDFTIVTLRLKNGETVQVAADVVNAPTSIAPEMVSTQVIETLFEVHESALLRRVRAALAADPRFITLYHRGEEYGCLREFFPPMSPDVLDAALAILLDSLFDQGQIPIQRLTPRPDDEGRREGRIFNPSALFSHRYLRRALQRDPAWDSDLRDLIRSLRALWSRAGDQGQEWNAQRTETALVQPLLRALGWSSVPLSALDPATQSPGSSLTQHVLCQDRAACAALYTHQGPIRSTPGLALALVQTVPWSSSVQGGASAESKWWRNLESSRSQPATASYQMVQALVRHHISWGILTNGRTWRLFTRRTNSIITEFHEVDLGPLFERLYEGRTLTTSQWVMLRQWWMLFRKDAFVTLGEGISFIDRLYENSPARRQESRIHLRQRIVQDVFPKLAGGFVAYRHQRLGISSEDNEGLVSIQRASLALLTRLLFLLVAEAKSLLPVDNPEYKPHSLSSLLSWAESCRQAGAPPNSGLYTTPRYDILLSLLQRVNDGDSSKNLPQYGPVFFDPQTDRNHAFILEHRLSDAVVAEVLNLLQRGVDYLSLDAYELGAVLGPLLHIKLQVIDAAKGEVALTKPDSDPGYRNSPVVPDYVATDVVSQVLHPLMTQRGARFADVMDRVVSLRHKLQQTLGQSSRANLQAALDRASHKACDTLLGLRVVDPAMGTGTFLLSAIDVVTDSVIEQIQSYHDTHPDVPWHWNPVQNLLIRVRRDLADELDRQGIEVRDQVLDDVSIMRRLIAQQCIYGVDRNPAAVDLSQISLWLRTFVPGAPLVFVKHRLRAGDSLLGTDLESLQALTPSPFEVTQVCDDVSMMYSVIDRINISVLDVRWSQKQFRRVEQGIIPYRQYLDAAVKAALGDDKAQALFNHWGASLLQVLKGETSLDEQTTRTLDQILSKDSYFHWPLEFLDAFVDFERRAWAEDPGFDVVVGQIPEIMEQKLIKVSRLVSVGESVRFKDAYQAFVHVARRLTAHRGGKTSCVLTGRSLGSKPRAGSLRIPGA